MGDDHRFWSHSINFNLDATTGALTIGNTGSSDITATLTVDQVGDDAHSDNVNLIVGTGDEVGVYRDTDGDWTTAQNGESNVYLPLVIR